jgi:hypothetical protein
MGINMTNSWGQVTDNTKQLAEMLNYSTVVAVVDVFTLNLATARNFAIEPADVVAKTITFSNVPTTAGLMLVVVIHLIYTNAAAITYPTGTPVSFVPALVAGTEYDIQFISFDAGTSWAAAVVGEV